MTFPRMRVVRGAGGWAVYACPRAGESWFVASAADSAVAVWIAFWYLDRHGFEGWAVEKEGVEVTHKPVWPEV